MAEKRTYERVAKYVTGIGESLEKITGTDVLLHSFEVSKRSMRGDAKTFVSMQISTVDDPDNLIQFHAWSDSLSEKLGDLPDGVLPALVKFVRVATAGGYRVWSIE